MKSRIRMFAVPFSLLAIASSSACAVSKTVPVRYEAPTAAVGSAHLEHAGHIPEARPYLQLAEDAIERARDLDREGRRVEAARLLERAHADAGLAIAIARRERARTEGVWTAETSGEIERKVEEFRVLPLEREPNPPPTLEAARRAFDESLEVGAPALAPVEARVAWEALRDAEAAWTRRDRPERIEHLAYVAQRKAHTALVAAETARLLLRDVPPPREAGARPIELASPAARAAIELPPSSPAAAPAVEPATPRQLAAEMTPPDVPPAAREGVLLAAFSSDLAFESASTDLTEDAKSRLGEVAAWLRSHRKARVEVAAHTDSTGPRSKNDALSIRQAEAVARYLVAHGARPKQLVVKGYGSRNPLVPNASDDDRRRNRRVEVRVMPPNGGATSASKSGELPVPAPPPTW